MAVSKKHEIDGEIDGPRRYIYRLRVILKELVVVGVLLSVGSGAPNHQLSCSSKVGCKKSGLNRLESIVLAKIP